MIKQLMIVRHGNTFDPQQTPLRIGAHTDLPLSKSGREQAKKMGEWLKQNQFIPDILYTSQLQRTVQTAAEILEVLGIDLPILKEEKFNEIDYGPDEGKPEAEVIARLGTAALRAWDEQATIPPGWQVDPALIIQNWISFAKAFANRQDQARCLVITSNGIARFAAYLTASPDAFKQQPPLKVSTGAVCILNRIAADWQIERWNFRPD